MTEIAQTKHRRGRIFPDIQWSEERIAHWQAETKALRQRCQSIFDRLQPELIKTHYDWYIAIEPETGSYILERDQMAILKKVPQIYPNAKTFLFRINETGVCGTI